MLLAHAVWERTDPGVTATEESWSEAYDATMREIRAELSASWSALAPGQRRALAAVAENRASLYASDRAHGGSRGGAVRSAVRALVDRGEVVEERDATTGHRVVDPLLAAWVREGRPGV